jgi:hypothetical protein
MMPVQDGYRHLLLAVIHRAVLDARAGDLEAREWLLSRETRELADWLGLPCWPPPLERRRDEFLGATSKTGVRTV